MANTYISRTFGTPTNSAIWTLSVWIKRSSLSGSQKFFSAGTGSTDRTEMYFASGGNFSIYSNLSGTVATLNSTRLFRDTSAWYHFVVQNNNGTAAVYCNGETVSLSSTSLGTNKINLASTIHIFGDQVASGQNFDGIMSHIHFVDGTIYAPTVFGSTDSTTGEWKINTSPSITMGNNGFTILKDGNTITDQSANSNNFSLSSGTLTKTEDCPSNVFATWNPLDGVVSLGNSDFQHGNTKFNSETSTNVCWTRSTLGMTSGKFYFEFKVETIADHVYIGIADRASPNTSTYFGAGALEYGYKSSSGDKKNNGTSTSYGNTWTTGDIVSCAVDLDNLKIYFGKNGTWQNSGDPTSGSTGTGSAYTITAPSLTNNGAYFFCGADGTSSNKCRLLANFGNGYFGTTAVSSAGTNASGIGIFEYDVPTGYTALSTKGLNL